MTWDKQYRRLEKDEIVQSGDEVQRDDGSWMPAIAIGRKAPDPNYTSHCVYRRYAAKEAP